MRKVALSLATSLLLSSLATAEDPLEIVKKVAANYAAMLKTSYDFEMVEVRESQSTFLMRTEHHQRIMGAGGRFREEALPSGLLCLFDGQFLWSYNPDRNEYTKTQSKWTAQNAPGLAVLELAAYQAKSARVLRQETLDLATGPVVCQVVEVEREPTHDQVQYSHLTYWIDTSRNLILKMNYQVTVSSDERKPSDTLITVSFPKASVGQPVEVPLLYFTPPADATEVEKLTFGPKPR